MLREKMNYRVPEFEMEGDYSLPASPPRARKSTLPEEAVMELLWQNGQVVMQSQTQRSGHKKSKYDAVIPEHTRPPVNQPQNPQLFMQEDEMAAWLQCPLGDDDPFCAELLYTDSRNAPSNNTAANPPPISPPPPPRPPIHPPPPAPRRIELPNFLHFSRMTNNNNNNTSRFESAAAEPSESKSVDSRLDASNNNASGGGGGRGLAATATMSFGAAASAVKDAVTCETSLTSSTGDSSASGSLSAEQMSIQQKPPPPPPPPAVEDRKRKGRVADDAECQSEDVELESGSGKKQTRGSSSTKRSRAAEVHNLSERRRRDRINEKMRSLQELIPRCNKSDKASMLDEAIEYLKSLQLQVQMMSMGCGMVPMMFPGVQQYMPMGMGMGMGMGMRMGMEMGMSRPVMPFSNVLAGSTMPTAPATAHMGPRFPLPPFQMQTMLPNDPNRVQATNQSEHMLNSLGTQNQNQSRVTNFADPYQQYFTPQQMRMQLQQNQAMAQPSPSKPSSSMGPENQESHQ